MILTSLERKRRKGGATEDTQPISKKKRTHLRLFLTILFSSLSGTSAGPQPSCHWWVCLSGTDIVKEKGKQALEERGMDFLVEIYMKSKPRAPWLMSVGIPPTHVTG